MTTIYDIAKQAGVSAATVSKVLNGYTDVSARTRAKVQSVADSLGYFPNATARGLVTKRSMLIGVFLQDPTNGGLLHPFFQDVIASFKDGVGEQGYDIIVFASSQGMEMDYTQRARQRGVDGVLLFGIPKADPHLAALKSSDIPCIAIDSDMLGRRVGYVISDNQKSAETMVDFLVGQGHQEIGYVSANPDTRPGHDRLLGFYNAMERYGLPVRSEWMMEGNFTEETGYAAMVSILQADKLPTAVFFSGDMMALGGMQALRDNGLEPGIDMSVCGFDDITLARYVSPSLTTIRQKRTEMGRSAARELLSLIDNPVQPSRVVTVSTELVIRDSVQPVSRKALVK